MNVPATASTAAAPVPAQARDTSALVDFNQFLNLFVSQLKHQDPLSPLNGEEFMAQTAQFSSVEQLVQLNQRMGNMMGELGLTGRATIAALIGRTVAARAEDGNGAEQDVFGRVVAVDCSDPADMILGLEDGTRVRFSTVTSINEV